MMGESYLYGFGMFGRGVQHIRFGRNFELYVDDYKAIMRVAVYRNGDFAYWRERVFPNLYHRQMMRMQIAMLLMSDETEDLGTERIELDGRQECLHCDGMGTMPDMDGDELPCTYCGGQGWC